MCVPTKANVVLQLPQAPKVKYTSDLVVANGNDKASGDITKRGLLDKVKCALFIASCLLVVGGNGIFSTPVSSGVMNRLSKLTHDLNSLDQLKKEFVDDELEIQWDRQHIRELQENTASMKESFKKLARTFDAETKNLYVGNESLREALAASAELQEEADKFDRQALMELSRQADMIHMQLDQEGRENARLRRLLAETMDVMRDENLPVPQAALRGAAPKQI